MYFFGIGLSGNLFFGASGFRVERDDGVADNVRSADASPCFDGMGVRTRNVLWLADASSHAPAPYPLRSRHPPPFALAGHLFSMYNLLKASIFCCFFLPVYENKNRKEDRPDEA